MDFNVLDWQIEDDTDLKAGMRWAFRVGVPGNGDTLGVAVLCVMAFSSSSSWPVFFSFFTRLLTAFSHHFSSWLFCSPPPPAPLEPLADFFQPSRRFTPRAEWKARWRTCFWVSNKWSAPYWAGGVRETDGGWENGEEQTQRS